MVILYKSSFKQKICSSKLGRFCFLIPGCAWSLHHGAEGSKIQLFWRGVRDVIFRSYS